MNTFEDEDEDVKDFAIFRNCNESGLSLDKLLIEHYLMSKM